MKLFLSLIAFAFLFLIGCTKDIGPNTDLLPIASVSCDSISYSNHIKPIIDNKCVNCHYPGSPNPGGDLSVYAGLKAMVDAGQFKARVIDLVPSPMPVSAPLPQAEMDLIKCWLNAGAPNN